MSNDRSHFRTDKWHRRAKRFGPWMPAILTVITVALHITLDGPPLGVWHGVVLYAVLDLFVKEQA